MNTNISFSASGLTAKRSYRMLAAGLIALALSALALTSCENQTPFDTQSADDEPLFLKPYESETGLVYGEATNPDPYVDSVLVTPSDYTTVNWYVEGTLVYSADKTTNFRIEKCFPTGVYNFTIEAVTTKGKRTTRDGVLTINPAKTDPNISAVGGVHLAPGIEMTLNGSNLDNVVRVILANDWEMKDTLYSVVPTAKEAKSLKLTLPPTEDGSYFLRLEDSDGTIYGSDKVQIHNNSLILSGYDMFSGGEAWTIQGVKLQDVAAVKVGETVVTELTATAGSITLIAPDLEVNQVYSLSVTNRDGSDVLFSTDGGLVSEVTTFSSPEKLLWEGPVNLDWNTDLIKVTKEEMTKVQVGDTIRVYYTITAANYHCIRINTPAWGDETSWEENLVPQINGLENEPSPLVFVYDERCKGLVDSRDAMCAVGFGASVSKITYQRP